MHLRRRESGVTTNASQPAYLHHSAAVAVPRDDGQTEEVGELHEVLRRRRDALLVVDVAQVEDSADARGEHRATDGVEDLMRTEVVGEQGLRLEAVAAPEGFGQAAVDGVDGAVDGALVGAVLQPAVSHDGEHGDVLDSDGGRRQGEQGEEADERRHGGPPVARRHRRMGARWRVDELPRWRVDDPARSRVDEPARWRVDEPARSRVDEPARSRVDEPARSRVDELARWRVDGLAQWRVHEPARWRVDEPAPCRQHVRGSFVRRSDIAIEQRGRLLRNEAQSPVSRVGLRIGEAVVHYTAKHGLSARATDSCSYSADVTFQTRTIRYADRHIYVSVRLRRYALGVDSHGWCLSLT